MIAACLGLVVVRRCTITGLPVLLAVIVTGWISFATVGFWSGHLGALFGDLGNLGGNLTSSVTDRMIGTPQHRFVLDVRSAFAAAFLLMAVGGVLRRRRRVTDDRVLIALMCMPFLAFATQSYGGEIALRVYLFALPAAAVLTAYLFFPRDAGRGRRPPVARFPAGDGVRGHAAVRVLHRQVRQRGVRADPARGVGRVRLPVWA